VRPIAVPPARIRALVCAALAVLAGVALACQKSDPLVEVRALQERGELYESLEPLRALMGERPDDPEVQFRYGRALALLGHVSQGEFALQKAMEDRNWLVPAGLQLALGAMRIADYAQAVSVATRVLEAQSDNVAALLIRAEARARDRKELDAALADADRALALEPDRLEAQKPRILALLALDRIDEASATIADLGKQLEGREDAESLGGWRCAIEAVFTEERGTYEMDVQASAQAGELWKKCLADHPGDSDVVTNAVDYYDDRGELDRSVDVLRAAVAAGGLDADAYRSMLVPRLRQAGKPEEAEALLQKAAGDEDAYRASIAGFELAEHYQALGDYGKGLAAADQAIARARELGTPEPQLLFELADAQLLAEKLDLAEATAHEMTVGAHRELVLARVAQERGDYARALRHYDEAFRLWPENGDARFTAALAAEAAGDFERAVEHYRYAIRVSFADTEARTRLARLHLAEGKPVRALEILEIQGVPPDSDAALLALRLRAQLGELSGQKIEVALERGARKPEQIARALVAVAQGMRARGDAAAAMRLLREQKGVSLREPEGAVALRELVAAAQEAGQPAVAVAAARDAVAAHPDSASAQEALGSALEASGGRREDARAAYARAVELDAKDARAMVGLARLTDDANEALARFDRAVAADPDSDEAVLGAARALAAAGRAPEAEARLAAALPRHPLAREIAYALVDLRLARGDTSDETLAAARRAVRLGGRPEAWDRLARVHAGRGDADKAAAAASHARSEAPDGGKQDRVSAADD
jgi:tetratricopeptide (TPR) repeat protein